MSTCLVFINTKVSLGLYILTVGFFTQLQRTYNDKKELFWHKGSLG